MAFFNFFLIKITSSMDVGSKEFIKSLDLPTGATSWKAGAQWYAARRPSNQDLWYVMEAVSMKYQTEVIGVNLQPEKSFELRAYATGKLKRKLIYAPATGGWTS